LFIENDFRRLKRFERILFSRFEMTPKASAHFLHDGA
jgi:hypothetical protein